MGTIRLINVYGGLAGVLIILVISVIGLEFHGYSSAAVAPSTQAPDSETAEAGEWEMLALINDERESRSLAPLKMQTNLRDYARYHAKDLESQGRLWHDMPEYALWLPSGYTLYGENVANNLSIPEMHTAFMNSPGHRNNILNPDYNYVGIGVSTALGGLIHVSQNFMNNSGSPEVAEPPEEIPGDSNADGRINALDLSLVLAYDGRLLKKADFNRDGVVGAADLAILLSKWTW